MCEGEGGEDEGGGGECSEGNGDVGEGERARVTDRFLFGRVVLLIARASTKARVDEVSRGGSSVSHCGGGGSG